MKVVGKGVTREGEIRDGTIEEITWGTHVSVYPALFCRNLCDDLFRSYEHLNVLSKIHS